MSDLTDPIFHWLYKGLTLRTAGGLVGLMLVISHFLALVRAESLKAFLKKMPRNKPLGILLFIVVAVWALILITSMDLGEFWKVRKFGQLIIVLGTGLMITYVDEFLSARALGTLMILAAAPVLDAAFLQLPMSRLLLPVLAYVWIILGMCYVGMPYMLRDHIGWVTASASRWRAVALGGLGYGILILACAFAFWG
jgi:hypothetical protein